MISRKKIAPKAFNMFRDFTKNVKSSYPNINLNIVDETLLVNDLVNSINKARKSLLKEEKMDKRRAPGYDIGFMIGFIAGNLSVHWEYEYVVRQSEDYKQFCCIKAMRIYLEWEGVTALRIRNIYAHLVTDGVNIEDVNKTIPAQTLDEWLIDENKAIEPPNEILQTLHNYENKYIKQYLLHKPGEFLDAGIDYFTQSELNEIIENGIEDI